LPRRAPRSRHLAIASLIVAGTFTLAANVAAGLEPGPRFPAPIPDSAFGPVVVPSADPALNESARSDTSTLADDLPAFDDALPALEDARLQDTILATPPPARPQPSTAVTKPVIVQVPPPAPKTTHALSGLASWYCRAGVSICTAGYPDDGGVDAYAAAGPDLRAAIGSGWRGKIVYVDGLRVRLIDWCQCYHGEPHEKLLDLYYDVYARVGGNVTIRW
jgi:hypothetical protein